MTPTTSNTGGGGAGADAAIDPLMGVASSAFNDYMQPYISLEEQSMDEQLVEALEDRTVDNRGDRPVFISSTNLFGKENKDGFGINISIGRMNKSLHQRKYHTMHGAVQRQGIFLALSSLPRFIAQVLANFGTFDQIPHKVTQYTIQP
jgi:hypothetical protein